MISYNCIAFHIDFHDLFNQVSNVEYLIYPLFSFLKRNSQLF